MEKNFLGEIRTMYESGEKPNYSEIARKYDMDWRTVKKYYLGYRGKPPNHNKPSRLDKFEGEIRKKLEKRSVTVRSAYENLVCRFGLKEIGSYSNFSKYVKRKGIKKKQKSTIHPRYETPPGKMGQVDWKEKIKLSSKSGEKFCFNVFHHCLKFSRLSYFELSIRMQKCDVHRALANSFNFIGGVPEVILFDNMSTVSDRSIRGPTASKRGLQKTLVLKRSFVSRALLKPRE